MSQTDDQSKSLKENVLSDSIWIRIIYMVLFYAVGHIVIALVLLIAVVQAVLTLVTGGANGNLQEFSGALNRYLFQTASFLTFNSDHKPFPFSDWPSAGQNDTEHEES